MWKLIEWSNTQSVAVVVSTLLVSAVSVPAAAATSDGNRGRQGGTERDKVLVQNLFNNGVADPGKLSLYPRAETVRALVSEQATATGQFGVGIAFMLAVVHYNYRTNRRLVVTAATACIRKKRTPTSYDEEMAFYVCDLFERGDTSLLDTLFDIGLHSDGDLTEGIGTELGDVVEKRPRLFLRCLSRRPVPQQRDLALLAGSQDGGGMSDADLKRVRASLKAIERSNSVLGPTARLCLRQIERANAQARSAMQKLNGLQKCGRHTKSMTPSRGQLLAVAAESAIG